jgi:hypothetical protein
MTASINTLIKETNATFHALPEGEVQPALQNDRIVVRNAKGKEVDVLVVMVRKNKVLVTKSLVNDTKVSVRVMDFPTQGVLLTDGDTLVLRKSATGPIPGRKGQKRVEGAPSKKALCEKIFLEQPDADKKVVCKRFQAEANCTRMGANTYYLSISKAHQAGTLVAEEEMATA